jgi:hypothetical protein
MSSRIYQSYYKPEQKAHLDPEFYPYDNTSNPVNNLYELYLYHRIREISIQDGIERWGMFSWQWRNKIKYKLDASSIVHIANQDEHDICLFNAYPDDEHINAAASLIGGQNVEFIKMYRDIHIAAIRHSSAVNREFASDYLIRAPSLAERIQGGKYWVSDPVLETYLSSAAQLTGSTSNTLFGARKLLEAKD